MYSITVTSIMFIACDITFILHVVQQIFSYVRDGVFTTWPVINRTNNLKQNLLLVCLLLGMHLFIFLNVNNIIQQFVSVTSLCL